MNKPSKIYLWSPSIPKWRVFKRLARWRKTRKYKIIGFDPGCGSKEGIEAQRKAAESLMKRHLAHHQKTLLAGLVALHELEVKSDE